MTYKYICVYITPLIYDLKKCKSFQGIVTETRKSHSIKKPETRPSRRRAVSLNRVLAGHPLLPSESSVCALTIPLPLEGPIQLSTCIILNT